MKKIMIMLSAAVLILSVGCFGERESGTVLLNKAYKSAVNGDWEQSLNYAKRAANASPESVDAHILYALALENNQKTDSALEEISRALTLAPQDFFALYTKGRILFDQGRMESCISPLTEALKQRPGDSNTLILLAEASAKLNDNKSAWNYYCMLIRQKSYQRSQPVWNELGMCSLLNRNNVKQAESYFYYSWRLAPDNPTALLNLAVFYDKYLPAKRRNAVYYYNQYLSVTKKNSALADKRTAVETRLKSLR